MEYNPNELDEFGKEWKKGDGVLEEKNKSQRNLSNFINFLFVLSAVSVAILIAVSFYRSGTLIPNFVCGNVTLNLSCEAPIIPAAPNLSCAPCPSCNCANVVCGNTNISVFTNGS